MSLTEMGVPPLTQTRHLGQWAPFWTLGGAVSTEDRVSRCSLPLLGIVSILPHAIVITYSHQIPDNHGQTYRRHPRLR